VALGLAIALFALVSAVAPSNASAACASGVFAPLALSTFEGADGDQCDSDGVGPLRDWENVAASPSLSSTVDAPSSTDTIYGPNNAGIVGGSSDENVPDSWNFTVGNLGGGKFDALAAFSFTDPTNNKLFLDLGFIRAESTGATFLAFELNQKQPGYRLDANESDPTEPFAVPTRTAGDLLVTYTIDNHGAQVLGLCSWDGDEHTGQWEEFSPTLNGAAITNGPCPALSNTLYQSAINDAQGGRAGDIPAIENFLTSGQIDEGKFGEAVVNLTDALKDPANPNGPQPCVDFGYVWLHSRSTDSLTSAQQDFILPQNAVSIGNCSVEGKKFNDLNGDGAQAGAGEVGLGGWTIWVDYDNDGVLDNNKDATFVNDMDGVVEAGEEEPYDVTADGTGTEALGAYRITDVQTSALAPGGTWPVREELQAAWDCTAAVGAGAVIVPNVCPEDTGTNPDNALGFRLAWLNNDTHTGRDFGNRKQPATLKVIKHVVNDNGGTSGAADFNLHVKDSADADVNGSPAAGSETGTVYTLNDGDTFTVTEDDPAPGYSQSYSGDCDANGDVTVAAGTQKTCTITNDDIAPELTVIKHVINDDGGTADANDFTMDVTATNPSDASFPGAESPGTTITLDQGNYSVDESGGPSGYAKSLSADCSGSINVGQSKTCTITNDDEAAELTVIKHVVNDNGGNAVAGDFNMDITATNPSDASFPGAESPGTTITVEPGNYSVDESGGPSGYAKSASADCSGAIALGQSKTCTITNDDIAPELTIVKNVVNKGSSNAQPSAFQMDVTATNPSDAHFPGTSSGKTITLDQGNYSVDESGGPSTFEKSLSADCVGSIAVGQKKTCTITNTKILPGISITKKGSATAYHGDKLTFTFEVTTPINSPLHDVVVTDNRCAPVTGPVEKQGGDQDDELEVGELWLYTCTMDVPAHTDGDTQLVNTATLTGKDRDDEPVSDTDTHSTQILHPAVGIDKTGPLSATAGELIEFTMTVTNGGDRPLHNVAVNDPRCVTVPTLQAKNRGAGPDPSPDTLDPGDSWIYTCSAQTQAGQTQFDNTATVTATDGGRDVTASDSHTTPLSQLVVAGERVTPGSARLGSKTGCQAKPFTVRVKGNSIVRVDFSVDGKRKKSVLRPDSAGRWTYRVDPRKFKPGRHKLTAKATFDPDSGTRAKTMTVKFSRCVRAAQAPAFTG
jgi:hypothetical protein